MSTTSYNPNEGNVPPGRVTRRQSLTNVESEAGNSLALDRIPNAEPRPYTAIKFRGYSIFM